MPDNNSPNRREVLQQAAGAFALPMVAWPWNHGMQKPMFEISLNQWSLHKTIFKQNLDNLDFARTAKKEFGIKAVEYLNSFFKGKAEDVHYLRDMRQRTSDFGVRNLLILVDGEGRLGDPDKAKRAKAVENHYRWVTAAKALDCHSIRVNAASSGKAEQQQKLATDGLRRLCEFAAEHSINIIVENHGGLSSNGQWLAKVIKDVGLPNCGTMPDFKNFRISRTEFYDPYKGVKELMPYAKAVTAKSHEFDKNGDETGTDFFRMIKIVVESGYDGYIGIEYDSGRFDEYSGIRATKALLEKIRANLTS